MSSSKLNIVEFSNPAIRTLHISWVAFFITFLVWFSHAPLLVFIKEAFNLSSQQIKALLILGDCGFCGAVFYLDTVSG